MFKNINYFYVNSVLDLQFQKLGCTFVELNS